MKKNIKIFILVYAITLLGLFALNAQNTPLFDAVEKGYYFVYVNDTIVSQHSKPMKAFSRALEEKTKDQNARVWVSQPNIQPVSNFVPTNPTEAQIISVRYPTDKAWLLTEPLPNIAIGNGCDSLARTTTMISKENFDFKDEKVILNNVHWTLEKGLYNNGKSITVIEALSQDLIQMMCSQDQVEISAKPIVGNVDIIHEGWANNMDGSFSYDGLGSYKYLVFTLNETLKIGDTVKITFDVFKTETLRPLINLWLYAESGLGYNGGIIKDVYLEDGSKEFVYTIIDHDRFRFGIRARNNDGGAFRVSNIKIVKQ